MPIFIVLVKILNWESKSFLSYINKCKIVNILLLPVFTQKVETITI